MHNYEHLSHGNNWATIGKIMGRMNDVCKDMHRRLRLERNKTGTYSEQVSASVLNETKLGGNTNRKMHRIVKDGSVILIML